MTYPSELIWKITDDLFDFLSILLDELEGKYSDSNHSVVFGDDSFVDFGKTSFSQEVGLWILVGPVFEWLDHLYLIIYGRDIDIE